MLSDLTDFDRNGEAKKFHHDRMEAGRIFNPTLFFSGSLHCVRDDGKWGWRAFAITGVAQKTHCP